MVRAKPLFIGCWNTSQLGPGSRTSPTAVQFRRTPESGEQTDTQSHQDFHSFDSGLRETHFDYHSDTERMNHFSIGYQNIVQVIDRSNIIRGHISSYETLVHELTFVDWCYTRQPRTVERSSHLRSVAWFVRTHHPGYTQRVPDRRPALRTTHHARNPGRNILSNGGVSKGRSTHEILLGTMFSGEPHPLIDSSP